MSHLIRCIVAGLALMLAAPAASAEPWSGDRNWTAGLRLSAVGLTESDGAEVDFAGLGLYARYRLGQRWELELGLDALQAELDAGLRRDAGVLSAAGLLHLRPHSQWDWYLLATIGALYDSVRVADTGEILEERTGSYLGVGVGLERRFERLTLGAELRLIGTEHAAAEPTDDQPPTAPQAVAAAAGSDAATEATGAQLVLSISYSF